MNLNIYFLHNRAFNRLYRQYNKLLEDAPTDFDEVNVNVVLIKYLNFINLFSCNARF